MEIWLGVLGWVIAVAFAYIFFLETNKSDPANKTFDKVFEEALRTLSARVKILENSKQSKVELVELTDAMKQIMKDHAEIKKATANSLLEVSAIACRLIRTFRPDEVRKKEKSA